MKIILINLILLLCLNVNAQTPSNTQNQDTVKKYILKLTESEYKVLQQKLEEAAEYEAQLTKQQSLQGANEFLKSNTQLLNSDADTTKKK